MRKAAIALLVALTMATAFALEPKMLLSGSASVGFNIAAFDASAQMELGIRLSDSFAVTAGANARITKSIFTDPDAAPSPSVGPFVGIRAGRFNLALGILSNWTIRSSEPAYQNWIPYIHTGLFFPLGSSESKLRLCSSLDWYMNSAGENMQAKTFEAIWNIIVPKVEIGLAYDFR